MTASALTASRRWPARPALARRTILSLVTRRRVIADAERPSLTRLTAPRGRAPFLSAEGYPVLLVMNAADPFALEYMEELRPPRATPFMPDTIRALAAPGVYYAPWLRRAGQCSWDELLALDAQSRLVAMRAVEPGDYPLAIARLAEARRELEAMLAELASAPTVPLPVESAASTGPDAGATLFLVPRSADVVPSPRDDDAPSRVFRFRKLVGGRPAFYALSPDNELLAPGLRVVASDESEDAVIAELFAAVETADVAARRASIRLLVDGDPAA